MAEDKYVVELIEAASAAEAGGALGNSSGSASAPVQLKVDENSHQLPKGSFVRKYNMLGERFYYCCVKTDEEKCTFSCRTYNSVWDHVNDTHFKKLLRCNRCPRAFTKLRDLQNHVYGVHKEKALACEEEGCSFRTMMGEVMAKHYADLHQGKPVPAHLRPLSPETPVVYAPGCQYDPETGVIRQAGQGKGRLPDPENQAAMQYASTIKIEGKNGGIKDVYVCTACTYEESHTKKGAVKTFSNSFTFKQHYKGVHLGHRLLCEYCSKEFQGAASYREHQMKVHGLPRGKKRVTKKKPKSPAKKTASKSRQKLSAKIKDTKKAAIQKTSLSYYRMENYPYHKTE